MTMSNNFESSSENESNNSDTNSDINSDTNSNIDNSDLEEEVLFNPFNPQNTEITLNDVQSILKNYGLPGNVFNLELYKRAMVHPSYTKKPKSENEKMNIKIVDRPSNCLPLKSKSYERLEFLGDGILEAHTKYYLYRRFPKENEGFMTEKKIALVKNESIGKIAFEMKLNKWLLISKNAEEKNIRTNYKKLGCLFESFLGALFLDFNKIDIDDTDNWFKNFFITGPGFQMSQIFIENIFEKHVNWIDLIKNDDNYKNIFQVKIQKMFKTTPHYIEIEVDPETGYHMGVFLCLGQKIHNLDINSALDFNDFKSLEAIKEEFEKNEKIFIKMGNGIHKIKKKAEQIACQEVLNCLYN